MRGPALVAMRIMLLLVVVLLAACGAQEGATPQADATAAPPATRSPGEALLQERCTRCHGLGPVQSAAKTLEGWQGTVRRMIGKGAVLDDAEFAALTQYLADTYR